MGKRGRGEFSSREVLSIIAHEYYQEGRSYKDIVQLLKQRLNLNYTEDAARDIVREIRERGMIQFIAPESDRLANQILKKLKTDLESVIVVETMRAEDVAQQAARVLLQMMRNHKEGAGRNRDLFRVGFLSGRTPLLLARFLSEMLRDPRAWDVGVPEDYPSRLVFSSLVATADSGRTGVDPHAFGDYFTPHAPAYALNGLQIDFHPLPGPGVVLNTPSRDEKSLLLSASRVLSREYSRILELPFEVILASCGHWGAGHNAVVDNLESLCRPGDDPISRELNAAWLETRSIVEQQGDPVGDFGWMPLNGRGELIDPDTLPVWAFTCLTPARLRQYLGIDEAGNRREETPNRVLLMVSPCGGESCGDPRKTGLVKALLDKTKYPTPLMTDLVMDSRTARALIE